MDGIYTLFELNGFINSMEDIENLLKTIKEKPEDFSRTVNSYTEKELVYLFEKLGFDIIRTRYIDTMFGNMDYIVDGSLVYTVFEYESNKLLSAGQEPTNTPRNVAVMRTIYDAAKKICDVLHNRKLHISHEDGTSTYYRTNLWKALNAITENISYCDSVVISLMTKGKFRTVIYRKDAPSKFVYTEDEPNKICYYCGDVEYLKTREIKYMNEWLAARMLFALLITEDHVHVIRRGKLHQLVEIELGCDSDTCGIMSDALKESDSILIDVASYLEATHPIEVSDDKMDDVIYNMILGEE